VIVEVTIISIEYKSKNIIIIVENLEFLKMNLDDNKNKSIIKKDIKFVLSLVIK
jgi:hypothetical protein